MIFKLLVAWKDEDEDEDAIIIIMPVLLLGAFNVHAYMKNAIPRTRLAALILIGYG